MRQALPDPRLRFLIGDVREKQRLWFALRDIDICVHAAALKRVETCEADPLEAVQTNVSGSANVAMAAIDRNVQKAVLLSTDKAALPNTLYGATKLVAERTWCAMNAYAAGTGTRLSATRYGNVLGSTGSVVPLWRAHADGGLPLPMTDPAMSRFWMPMSAAVDLVLLALRDMRGGETFVPKAGSSTIAQLADAIAPNTPWSITGLRPGEKMDETLVSADEASRTYDCGSHYVIEPVDRGWGDVAPLSCPRVPPGFSYRSDTNERALSADELRGLVAA